MGIKKITTSLVLAISLLILPGLAGFGISKLAYAISIGDIAGAVCGATPGCTFVSGVVHAVDSFPKSVPEFVAQLIPALEIVTIQQAWGNDAVKSLAQQPISPAKNMSEYLQNNGAIGWLALGMKTMYDHPPVTSSDYLASIKPIIPVYAAVPTQRDDIFGNEIITLWTAARNLSYIIFVLVLVAIGFMLMFRSKIDPRTTITITSALPSLIISLVLITFSMTLATLMINLGQLLMEVVKNIMSNPVLTSSPILQNPSSDSVGLTVGDILVRFFSFNTSMFANLGGGSRGAVLPLLLALILSVITFIVAVQVFFMLLLRYINLLVKPIYAPLAFMFGAIPGRGGTITSWFKSYLVDVLVFPTVLLLLNIGMAIRTYGGIGDKGDPFGMIETGANLAPIIALGILVMATKVPAFLEEVLGVKASSYVGGSGSQPHKIAQKVPIIGSFLK